MRLIPYVLLFVSPCVLGEEMQSIDSEVFATAGTQAEITKRGETCIAQLVHFDGVALRDATSGGPLSTFDDSLTGAHTRQQIAGGNVIVSSAPDVGVVVANNRVRFKYSILKEIAQSTLTFESKDGRFRIIHSAIQAATENTGISGNNGFQPVHPKSKMAAVITEKLQAQSADIAACVQKRRDDW